MVLPHLTTTLPWACLAKIPVSISIDFPLPKSIELLNPCGLFDIYNYYFLNIKSPPNGGLYDIKILKVLLTQTIF
jgi:hypothetical protein